MTTLAEPSAMRKAKSLYQYASRRGAPITEFQLILTESEAFELLDYLAAGGFGQCQNDTQLQRDIKQAKKTKNPWTVLTNWQLFGFNIVPSAVVLH